MFEDFEMDMGVLLPAVAMWLIISGIFLWMCGKYDTPIWMQLTFVISLAPITYLIFLKVSNK